MPDTPAGPDRPTGTVADLIGRCLIALDATRVFGSAASGLSGIPGLPHVLVEDASLAVLLADAAGRIGRGPGVALLPGRILRLSSQPGADAERVLIDDVAALPTALAAWDVGAVFAAAEYELAIDIDAPVPDGLGPVQFDAELQASTLAPEMADVRSLVLAGPGVVRSGAVSALHDVATRLGAGVVNTWGAKGVYRWDSPSHFGTAGLQERDAELAGLTTAELVITTGLDPAEMPVERWASGPILDVDPRTLEALTYRWEPSDRELVRPALYDVLSAALRPLYGDETVPLSPARAAADLGAARPAGGLVVADPGPAGLWVARALPTVEVASVVVPSLSVRGFALAAAMAASLEGRPAVAVVTDPLDGPTAELLALAEHWDADVVLEVWGADAPLDSAAARADRLAAAIGRKGVDVQLTPVDFGQTKVLVDAAGPVVAWPDRPGAPSGNGQG
jgi:thiamine pyrophosphate-dependent acetolactate synthase large subunit-like protein